MSVQIVRLGSPRVRHEGIRIGTVRRPPRGVPRSQYAEDDWYDVWLPDLAPSAGLVNVGRSAGTDRQWKSFMRRYRAEMALPEKARLVKLLAALSNGSDFSVGCYCEDESRCHRSVLRELLTENGAAFA